MPGEVALRPGLVGLDPNRADEIRLGARNVTKLFRDARSAAEKFCDSPHEVRTSYAPAVARHAAIRKFTAFAHTRRRFKPTHDTSVQPNRRAATAPPTFATSNFAQAIGVSRTDRTRSFC
jgi:hypothetical protein